MQTHTDKKIMNNKIEKIKSYSCEPIIKELITEVEQYSKRRPTAYNFHIQTLTNLESEIKYLSPLAQLLLCQKRISETQKAIEQLTPTPNHSELYYILSIFMESLITKISEKNDDANVLNTVLEIKNMREPSRSTENQNTKIISAMQFFNQISTKKQLESTIKESQNSGQKTL
jgi:predicted transposase YbfD/YdcC